MDTFSHLINVAVREGISDLHITGGHPIVYRNDGIIGFDRRTVWTHQQVDELVASLAAGDARGSSANPRSRGLAPGVRLDLLASPCYR